jgi:hypothetical protein
MRPVRVNFSRGLPKKELMNSRIVTVIPQLLGTADRDNAFLLFIQHNDPIRNREDAWQLMGNDDKSDFQTARQA